MISLMRRFAFLLFFAVSICVHAADFKAKDVFGTTPGRDLDAALKRAAKEKQRVLLFTYDPKDGGLYPGLDIKYFMDLLETKKLVKDNFILVVLTRGHKDLERYPSPGAPEKAYYVLINADGKTVTTGMAQMNGEGGLKKVKEWLAMP